MQWQQRTRLERLAQPFSPWQSWPPASTPGPCWARWPAGPGGLLAISPPRRLDPLELQRAPPSLALSRSTWLVSSQTLTFSHNPTSPHPSSPPRSLHSATKHAAAPERESLSSEVLSLRRSCGHWRLLCCPGMPSPPPPPATAATVPPSSAALPVVEEGPAILPSQVVKKVG